MDLSKDRVTSLFGGKVLVYDLRDISVEELPKGNDICRTIPDSLKEVAGANHVVFITDGGTTMTVVKSRHLNTPGYREEKDWFTKQLYTESVEESNRLRKWMQRIVADFHNMGWPDNECHNTTLCICMRAYKALSLALQGFPQDYSLGNVNPNTDINK